MIKILKSITFASIFAVSSLVAADFTVDKSHSSVGFEIKHMMISTVDGSFNEFNGEVAFDPKTNKIEALKGTVEAKSIDTGIEKRDNHLRSADFFEVQTYPQITFEMTSFEQDGDEGIVRGNLTMKGVTKPVELESEITGVIVDNGTTKVGLELEGEINRKDFGLNWNKVIEAGGIAVGEEVKLELKLQLHEKLDLSKL